MANMTTQYKPARLRTSHQTVTVNKHATQVDQGSLSGFDVDGKQFSGGHMDHDQSLPVCHHLQNDGKQKHVLSVRYTPRVDLRRKTVFRRNGDWVAIRMDSSSAEEIIEGDMVSPTIAYVYFEVSSRVVISESTCWGSSEKSTIISR